MYSTTNNTNEKLTTTTTTAAQGLSHCCSPTTAKPQIQGSLFALCVVGSNTQTLFSTCDFAR